ncbi:hypothetical protein CSKR_109631 [Clonorchis sinensis]|uniref:Uncharacterized protein n=1 Tax=Clonorchis sinensis TaxID=79923 RepID=A0A8T1MYB2_CLOSI|nr:hypothetical protein CSKR_109631 [Clonorchis sinensis]
MSFLNYALLICVLVTQLSFTGGNQGAKMYSYDESDKSQAFPLPHGTRAIPSSAKKAMLCASLPCLPEPPQCAMWWRLLIWALYNWLGFLTKLIERQFPEWVGSLGSSQ